MIKFAEDFNKLNMTEENNINKLEKEFVKLTLKKKPFEQKKYIITQNIRNKLIDYDNTILGIIPYYCKPNNINNFNKKYFINTTNIITYKSNIITEIIKTRKKERKEDYIKYIESILNESLKINLNIENIKKTNITKVLEIEKSKIIIYIINISSIKIIPKKYNLIKYIDLYNNIFNKTEYNNKLLKKKKYKKKIYENILLTKFNYNNLQKILHLYINNIDTIQIKLHTIYRYIYK